MSHKEFQSVLEARIRLIREVLDSKSKEYSSEEDRLENFKDGANLLDSTPLSCCLGYMTKHFVSVAKMVKDTEKDQHYTVGLWSEKIGDAINYLILLEALIIESDPTHHL